MNKTELARLLSNLNGDSISKSSETVQHILDILSQALSNKNAVQLNGFGSFGVKFRAPRDGRNPKTGEVIHIKGTNKIVFTASKKLLESVNE